MPHQLAARRNPAGEADHQAAEGIHLLGQLAVGEPGPGHRLEVVEVHPGLHEVDPGRLHGPERALDLVVLVGDVADDLLEQVLDGDEPIDAAVLVDDERHVDASGLHLLQQHPDRHRGRRIEQRPDQLLEVELSGGRPEAVDQRQVLQVHEPERLVERLAEDRQPRQRARLEGLDHLAEARVHRNRDDLRPGDADVLDALPAEVAKVDDELPAGRRVAAAIGGSGVRRLLILGGVAAEEAGEEGSPRTVRVVVVTGLRSRRRMPVG